MLGMSQAEVLECAGAPRREARDGGSRIMAYERQAFVNGDHRYCKVSVVLRSDHVERITSSGSQDLCRQMMAACTSRPADLISAAGRREPRSR